MHFTGKGKAVLVYLGDEDHLHGKPLATAIVERARDAGLAGATVLRGSLGFGAHSKIHTSGIVLLAENLPVIVHLVDDAAKIDAFLPALAEMVAEGTVVTWDVNVEFIRRAAGD